MLPRRSTVVRYVSGPLFIILVLALWFTGPDTGWLHHLEPLNETVVLQEFYRLKTRLNVSYSLENRSLEEVYGYVQAMKKQMPVNPHDFHFILNPQSVCKDPDVFLLTYVHTAPDHHKRRTFIRETWGNPSNFANLNHRVVFLMGQPQTSAIQDAVLMEMERYGDIVQEDFLDSYRNLTFKAIEGLKWISTYCSHTHFILKTDDDIFVNIFNVVSHLKSLIPEEGGRVKELLLCLVWQRMKVVRDPKSKWYIPKSEYSNDFFSTYCSGSAFMMTPDIAGAMYNASFKTPFFWVDDFYITGLLAQKVGVKHQRLNPAYILGPRVFMEKFTEEGKWKRLFFGHVHNINNANKVWRRVVQYQQNKTDTL